MRLGDALRQHLKPYKPHQCPAYKELIQWLNTTPERDVATLTTHVLMHMPKLGKPVPAREAKAWMRAMVEECLRNAGDELH